MYPKGIYFVNQEYEVSEDKYKYINYGYNWWTSFSFIFILDICT